MRHVTRLTGVGANRRRSYHYYSNIADISRTTVGNESHQSSRIILQAIYGKNRTPLAKRLPSAPLSHRESWPIHRKPPARTSPARASPQPLPLDTGLTEGRNRLCLPAWLLFTGCLPQLIGETPIYTSPVEQDNAQVNYRVRCSTPPFQSPPRSLNVSQVGTVFASPSATVSISAAAGQVPRATAHPLPALARSWLQCPLHQRVAL